MTLFIAALLSMGALMVSAAPYTQATVTRVHNRVSYGDRAGDQSAVRPAVPKDVIGTKNYLLSETDSRAELQYPDGSIVRIGQNTVFSFEADTRTLNLTKGSFIFYVPKGEGGGVIKTPSLTAAITGTVGKVSENTIAIIEGSIKLVPSGQVVKAGQFARRNPDGTITIDFFDPTKALDGKLMSFNGPLPPFREDLLTGTLKPDFNALVTQETLDRTANLPSANENFFPKPPQRRDPPAADRPNVKVFVPPPKQRPAERPVPEY